MARERLKKIKVEEFTTPSPFSVEPTTTLKVIAEKMGQEGFRHVPVVQNGDAVGIISDRDLNLAMALHKTGDCLASEIMTKDPYTVDLETCIDDVAYEMSKSKIGSAIVLNHRGKVFGIFTSSDALNASVEVIRGEV